MEEIIAFDMKNGLTYIGRVLGPSSARIDIVDYLQYKTPSLDVWDNYMDGRSSYCNPVNVYKSAKKQGKLQKGQKTLSIDMVVARETLIFDKIEDST